MTLAEYILALEELRVLYGDDIPVKVQTLTHRWDAEKPVVRMGRKSVLNPDIDIDPPHLDIPYVLVNP